VCGDDPASHAFLRIFLTAQLQLVDAWGGTRSLRCKIRGGSGWLLASRIGTGVVVVRSIKRVWPRKSGLHLKPFSRVCTTVPYPGSAKACAIAMGSGTSLHVPRFTGFDHRHQWLPLPGVCFLNETGEAKRNEKRKEKREGDEAGVA
jgi:hypothetical protein